MLRKISPVLLFLIVAFIANASAAVDCNSVQDVYHEIGSGDITSQSIICTNSVNSSSVTLVKGGSASPYFSLSESVIGQSTTIPTVKTVNIDFDESILEGNYVGIISFSDGSTPLSFLMEIESSSVPLTGCQINPSLVSYTQQVQQGTEIQMPKITFNPLECPGPLVLTASSVSIQGGIVTPSGQKPVFISSVESDGINIALDTEGLSSQTYNSKLKIAAFSKQFEIPFTIIVTGSASATGIFDINNLPTCSLTNTILNINSTYSMVCSNLVPDVTIEPVIDNVFIKGVGLDRTDSQFVWEFSPKKFGNSVIKAQFKYLGVPVGDMFEQEVKIQSSSGQTPGTNLILDFTPKLIQAQSGDTVLIQILDNKSRSLVENPELYIDGELAVNKTGRSFRAILDIGKNYSMRAVALGYNDLVENVFLSAKPLLLNITPETGDSNTQFIITTDVNATIYIDGEIKGNEYSGVLHVGEVIIEAFKEGYLDYHLNMTIAPSTIIPHPGEFKKNTLQIINLNKNASWQVYYQKNDDSPSELLVEGTGNKIEFTPTKNGKYIVTADSAQRIFEIKGWSGEIGPFKWKTWIFIIVIICLGLFAYYKYGGNSTLGKSTVGFGSSTPNYGGNIKY